VAYLDRGILKRLKIQYNLEKECIAVIESYFTRINNVSIREIFFTFFPMVLP
jgi:hypothetical protein